MTATSLVPRPALEPERTIRPQRPIAVVKPQRRPISRNFGELLQCRHVDQAQAISGLNREEPAVLVDLRKPFVTGRVGQVLEFSTRTQSKQPH